MIAAVGLLVGLLLGLVLQPEGSRVLPVEE